MIVQAKEIEKRLRILSTQKKYFLSRCAADEHAAQHLYDKQRNFRCFCFATKNSDKSLFPFQRCLHEVIILSVHFLTQFPTEFPSVEHLTQ